MTDWFRVEVSDHEGQIVAIETEMLAGRDIGDAERAVICKAIDCLSGFIGRHADHQDDAFVRVPREPTTDMLDAGGQTMFVDVKRKQYCDIVRRGYKAMLDAALAAQEQTKEGK